MKVVSRNLLSANKTLPQDSSASNSWCIKDWIRVLFRPATGNWCETATKTPTAYSQERQQYDTRSSGHRKLGRSGESASSASTTSKSEGQGWNSTICRSPTIDTLRKSSRICGKKWNLAEEAPVIGIGALETNVSMWGLFMPTTMRAVVHFGPNYFHRFGSLQEHQLRGNPRSIRYHAEIDIGPSSRTFMDEIYSYARPIEYVDESKRLRLLGSRIILEEHVRAFRSGSKMETWSWRISTVQFLQRFTWNWVENRLGQDCLFVDLLIYQLLQITADA